MSISSTSRLSASQKAENVQCAHHSILSTGPLKELNKYIHAQSGGIVSGRKYQIFIYFITHTQTPFIFKQKESYCVIPCF